jgi:hypothetical protein
MFLIRSVFLPVALLGVLALSTACIQSQSVGKLPTPQVSPKTADDLGWLQAFTGSYEDGGVGDVKWDARFQLLMKASFHQHQSFWREQGKLLPVPDLVEVFLGIPESVTAEENRFYTVKGCVPHVCTEKGMVWIDRQDAANPGVIFVAMDEVHTAEEEQASVHLWLFSRTKLNWQKLPPNFLKNLSQWWKQTQEYSKDTVPEELYIATIVQPTGETVDLTPGLLKKLASAATKK